jgi:hypothetical protein
MRSKDRDRGKNHPLQNLRLLFLKDDGQEWLHLVSNFTRGQSSIRTLCNRSVVKPKSDMLFPLLRPEEIEELPAIPKWGLIMQPRRTPVCRDCAFRLDIMKRRRKRRKEEED